MLLMVELLPRTGDEGANGRKSSTLLPFTGMEAEGREREREREREKREGEREQWT